MKEYTIDMRQAGQRADKFLFKILSSAPGSFVYKMIRKKNIVLNDRKMTGREILRESDVIRIYLSDETFEKFSAQAGGRGDRTGAAGRANKGHISADKKDTAGGRPAIPDPLTLPVLYEDDHMIVMNKPAGFLSQKADAADYSMNEWLLDYLEASGAYDPKDTAGFRPSICNRLDRNTSGLLLGGKTIHGLQSAAEMLRDRSLKKYYRAMVTGRVTEASELEGFLSKDTGRNQVLVTSGQAGPDASAIRTSWEPLFVYENASDLKVHLITGKTHQIRAHLASIGHPLIGDPKYGNRKTNETYRKAAGIRRQMLHAWKLELPDGRVFEAGLPEDYRRLIDYLSRQ